MKMMSTQTTSNKHPNNNNSNIEIIDLTMSDDDDDDDDEDNADIHYEDQIRNTAVKMAAMMATTTTNDANSADVFTSSMSSKDNRTSIHGTSRVDINSGGRCRGSLPLKKRKIRPGYNQYKEENGSKHSTNISVPRFTTAPTSAFETVVGGSRPGCSKHTLKEEQVPRHFLLNTATIKIIENKPVNQQNLNINDLQQSSSQNQVNERVSGVKPTPGCHNKISTPFSVLEQRHDTMNYHNIFSPISQPVQSTTMTKSTSLPQQESHTTNPPRRAVSSSRPKKKNTKKGNGTNEKKVGRQRRVRVLVPQRHDVLQGRSGSNFSHPGNVIHRKLVECRKVEYVKSTKSGEKHRIAKDIVTTIQTKLNPPGRFLRYDHQNNTDSVGSQKVASSTSSRTPSNDSSSSSSTSAPSGYWYMMDEKHAIEKTKQALRDCPVAMCGIK